MYMYHVKWYLHVLNQHEHGCFHSNFLDHNEPAAQVSDVAHGSLNKLLFGNYNVGGIEKCNCEKIVSVNGGNVTVKAHIWGSCLYSS